MKIPKKSVEVKVAAKFKPYDHAKIEPKWQKIWDKKKASVAKDFGAAKSAQKKFYALIEFPFPSGDGLHVGHIRSNTAMDVIARKRRREGYNVLYPIGWDAFGLPTENYAIKTGQHPSVVTKKNSDTFRKQLKALGFSFDWSREIDTTDPAYYRWTQWIFLQFLKAGLAYKKKMYINWCPKDLIGLANEEVVNGACERCGTKVEKRERDQWMLAITKYADRLDRDLDSVDFLERIKIQQRNWIGRSEGAEITFDIIFKNKDKNGQEYQRGKIPVYTTRPDTMFGVTYIVFSPEHPWVTLAIDEAHKGVLDNAAEVRKYITEVKNKTEIERTAADKEKTGIELIGVKAINPATKEEIPVYVADYVLAEYGTGAVMAVPAHDERDYAFAQKFKLPIRDVIMPLRVDAANPHVAGKKIVERRAIQAIIRDLKTGKFLCLKWKKQPWTTFIVGGVEGSEDIVEAARREILEETGYKNLKFVRVLGGPVRSEFFAAHKDENRVAFFNAILFELENEEKVPVSAEELDKHEPIWTDLKDIRSDTMRVGELDLWLKRLHSTNVAYEGDGELIESGKFNGKDSAMMRKEITDFVGGKWVVKHKLRDWIFSRQRYWGEPIPVVHCAFCAGKTNIESKATLSFYIEDVWKAIIDGKKTFETRAMNPEEPERYFGNIKEGDTLCFLRKKNGDKLYVKVKKASIIKNLDELFKNKELLKKVTHHKKLPKSLAQLESSYAGFHPGYLEKVKKNGLVAWEFEFITTSVPVPEKDLPVKLPKVKNYKPTETGESPLAAIEKWVNVKCPQCKGKAKRETDTMPNWAGSSWYYLRYIDPKNRTKFAAPDKLKYWTPVDWYNGGMEHTTLHLLYSRFWHKFLFDQGLVPTSEPYMKRTSHGLILGPGGEKMSKSRGNVVNPDSIVETVGADSLRLYEMFMGPFDQPIAWEANNIAGVRRFIEKIWKLQEKISGVQAGEVATDTLVHKTIKKVTEDIEAMRFNTAISAMMILVNEFEKATYAGTLISRANYEALIGLLAPFAPHVADELWSNLGHKESVHASGWPSFDPKKITSLNSNIAVQVNGKTRASFEIAIDSTEEVIQQTALALPEVKKWLNGGAPKKIIYVKGRLINILI